MYYIDDHYRAIKSADLFEELETALACAEEQASKDFESSYYYVSEIKALVKADPVVHPVKTAIITTDNALEILGITQDEEDNGKVTRASAIIQNSES